MATSSIPVYVCDRCGIREEMRQPHQSYSWGKILCSEANGPRWIGSNMGEASLVGKGRDICPKCFGEVFDWWKTPAMEARDADHG